MNGFKNCLLLISQLLKLSSPKSNSKRRIAAVCPRMKHQQAQIHI